MDGYCSVISISRPDIGMLIFIPETDTELPKMDTVKTKPPFWGI